MRYFIDKLSDEKVFSDAMDYRDVDDLFYFVIVEKTEIKESQNRSIGDSASLGPEETRETERAAIFEYDVVMSFQLTRAKFTLRDFHEKLRNLSKRIVLSCEDENRKQFLKSHLGQGVKKYMLDHFAECEFFTGPDAKSGILVAVREIDGSKQMIVMKDSGYWSELM